MIKVNFYEFWAACDQLNLQIELELASSDWSYRLKWHELIIGSMKPPCMVYMQTLIIDEEFIDFLKSRGIEFKEQDERI